MDKIITYKLSDNFIEKLCGFAKENFIGKGRDISRVCFVFGGRRPGLFLKRQLGQVFNKGFISPAFFSIDEFVQYILEKKSACGKISDLEAAFMIYKLAQEIAPDILKERESFARFLPWAREVLSFIEQLDLENIPYQPLKNVEFKAAIGFDVPENINCLLESIIAIRQEFHARQIEKKLYSRGLSYLLASKYISEVDFAEFDRICFCGFFYLHKTEKAIVKALLDAGKATCFFQGDSSEWPVLENLYKEIALPVSLSSADQAQHTKSHAPKISIQTGFDVHSEVGLAREALKKINNLDDTVIVLPQPDNLIPLLSEVASYTDNFNVSMGYPLKRSALYSLFECVFNAQETKKDGQYYTKDYLKLLAHPLVKNLRLFGEASVTRVLVHKIEEVLIGAEKTSLGGSLFVKLSEIEKLRELYDLALVTMKSMEIEVTFDELKSTVEKLHGLLFGLWENLGNFYEFSLSLEEFMKCLVEKSHLAAYPLNLKMAEKIFEIKEELFNSGFNREPFSKEEIFKIFDNKIDAELISFSGSPLKGLQVLGLFETRVLSFENVIILDVNEAVLPSMKIYEPLIPREVMIGLGINRLEKEEEIQRYQFRRLISGAKTVHLIYQKRPDKEKSRFIEELIWQEQKNKNSLEVVSIPQASFKVEVLPKTLEIKKDSKIISHLKGLRYSASSLNTYLACPLKFYYHYCLGLEEKDELSDEPEAVDIGNFLHDLLEETFSQFLNKKPSFDKRFRDNFFNSLNEKFETDFTRKMKSDSFLIKAVLDYRMDKFIKNEEERDVEELICVEERFDAQINLSGRDYKFTAKVDRIDRLSEKSFLILDYKTGYTREVLPLDAEKIEKAGFTREKLKNTLKSFQLPLYLYLVSCDKRFQEAKLNAGLYSLKNLTLERLFRKEEQFSSREKIMEIYLKAMDAVLSEIINPEVCFKADETNPRYCRHCPFFYLCR
ncbi:MAG: PD-(D/E)XK nuclease family protein [Candidatus Omnitrophica bacterium]|nr:PD-(D/E)XK nuclease family protein [Candidatus Omnitrophota bacterium]